MSKNYPVYNLNNETIVILPGSRFTKNELISRLHEINIDIGNYKNKKEIESLYDLNLMDDKNKFLLLNKLRKDTEYFKSKLEISQRQSIFESNANTISNNPKNKVLNITHDVKPFTENNSIQQEITISKPNNINRNSNYQNSYISNNMNNQNQEYDNYKNSYNNNQLRKGNSNNYLSSRNFQENNQSNINLSYGNNQLNNNNNNPSQIKNSINNINMNNDYNMNNKGFNNNSYIQSQINAQRKYDNIDNKGYNNYNNKDNTNYKEEINNDINRNNNNNTFFQDNPNNPKIFTNIRTPNPINIQDPTSHNNNFKNISFNPNENPFKEDNSQKMVIEEPRKSVITNEEDQSIYTNSSSKREPYTEPTLLSLLIVLITIGQIFLIYKYWDSIIEILTNPSRIFHGIFDFISSLFFGSISHFYYIIPLIILIAVIVIIFKKYAFKKRCEEIINKIIEYLINNQNIGENNSITEDDIYQRFVKNYGVSYEEFKKRYIKTLRRMRRNEQRLKIIGQSINGNEIMTWYLK